MSRFLKKPVVVEALQWTGENYTELSEWLSHWRRPLPRGAMGTLMIPTLEGEMQANPGDWIIRGVQGEFYPCKPEIFEMTYEPAY